MTARWNAARLAQRLRGAPAKQVAPELAERHAAVTLVARPGPSDLEILFVKRAEVPGDPWSGHMALPGGHRASDDPDLIETARRETREEVGLDLPRDAILGRLDDLRPVHRKIPSILITPFVGWHEVGAPVSINHEVQYHVWAPLAALIDPALRSEVRYTDRGEERSLPSILYDGDPIWGLTHRIVMNFLRVLKEGPSG